jgi:4-amino-4-deoxy-L-arabinose transferase-like glycosyltransferase
VYGFAGYFVYHDFLWVVKKIPYAHLSSVYGSGKLFHFAGQLTYVLGIPLYFLLILGILSLTVQLIRKKIQLESHILILGGFMAFFIAHTLFWYLGIFNSMGLKRVFVGVAPLAALLAAFGWEFLTEIFTKYKNPITQLIPKIILVYVFLFPFLPNPASVRWNKDMRLGNDEILALAVAEYLAKHEKPIRYLTNHPALDWAIGFDRFDPAQASELGEGALMNLKSGDYIIWDDWFSPLQLADLDKIPKLKRIKDFQTKDNHLIYVLYKFN